MKNVWQIIKREYLTRVKKKTFLLTTFLTPILIVVFGAILVLILSYQSDESPKIMIKDDNALITKEDIKEKKLNAELTSQDLTTLRTQEERDYAGVLYIPAIDSLMKRAHEVSYYSEDALAPDVSLRLESLIEDKIRKRKIQFLNYDEETLASLKTNVKVSSKAMRDDEDAVGPLNSGIAAVLGGIMGFIMYFVVSIYGSMVMRGVMEEKINRIVEVMVSSVRPFELMLGKVLGIGGVGLTQLLIWIIVFPLLAFLLQFLVPAMSASDVQQMTEGMGGSSPSEMEGMILEVNNALNTVKWHIVLPSFVIFFFGGYLLYAALFAAIGSAVGDDMGESQSLTLPVMIPIIFGIYIMFSAIQNPSSPLAVWSSMIPFFSPMVMPARLAFNPPMWQLILSIVILFVTVVAVIWLSGRIYRVGILMYGKKASFKELGRWLVTKR
ncbi:MAG TPA: ABC transporter permease [Saprospiraceae bacterium]|nr:ABC transporter permease [Saprospiraceae bacterium]